MTLEYRFEKVYINFYQNVRKYFLLILVKIIQTQSLLSACTVGRYMSDFFSLVDTNRSLC